MMQSYTSKESEWEQYALLDPSKHYTRNLVDEGNGKSNLVGTIGSLLETILISSTAYPSLESWQRQPHPRSRECSLCYEGKLGLSSWMALSLKPYTDLERVADGDHLRSAKPRQTLHTDNEESKSIYRK
jgi:hypothetical protein